MKKKFSTSYEDFFLQLPPTDNLNDIEIQDEYENQTNEAPLGLSEEQVSLIAIDSLAEANRPKPPPDQDQALPPTQQD